jgi:hypothetical protein
VVLWYHKHEDGDAGPENGEETDKGQIPILGTVVHTWCTASQEGREEGGEGDNHSGVAVVAVVVHSWCSKDVRVPVRVAVHTCGTLMVT